MSSEQLLEGTSRLLEELRKEVIERKKENIIRDLVSQRISEFGGQTLQPIHPTVSTTSGDLLANRMEALLNLTRTSPGQVDANHNNN